jgi:hypothetical protein
MLRFKIDGEPYVINNVITIEQYAKIYKIKDLFTQDYFAAKLISTVSTCPLDDLLDCPFEEIVYISNYITDKLPKNDDIVFKDKFELNGIEYGFFPNWRDLTFAEFIDMDTLSTKKVDELLDVLHILAAIMYRPITNKVSEHNFEIEKYDLTTLSKRAEYFKKNLDVSYVLGAQFFFIKYAKKFSTYTPPSLVSKMNLWTQIKLIWMMWRMIFKLTSKNRSGGFLSSTKLLTTILLNTNTSTKKTSRKF